MSPKDPNEIGALWVKSGPKGDYMTGTINGEAIVAFAMQSTNPKAPQWRILKARPKADRAARPAPDDLNEF